MKKVAVKRFATMSVFDGDHRTTGYVDPPKASVKESLNVFCEMLIELQDRGVKPGMKLRIVIETVPK